MEKLTVFDVETPNGKNDRICSIGIVRVEDRKIVESFSCLVDPECDFSLINTNLHGIGPEDVAGSPTFPSLWEKLSPLFYDGVVVAHNASFDLSVLRKTLAHYGIELHPLQYIDTRKMAKDCYPSAPNCRLDTLCELLDLHLEHHDAGSDALAAAELLLDMLNHHGLSCNMAVSYEYQEPSTRYRNYNLSQEAKDLLELRSLLRSITNDDRIDREEFLGLSLWLRDHLHLLGNYPFDDVLVQVMSLLEKDGIEQDDLDALCFFSQQILDPLFEYCETCRPDITGMNIVLTGEFFRGSRSQVASELTAMGALIQSSVTKKTGLVLVGALGSDAWVSGNYGTKIKRAIELSDSGIHVSIMREEDFFEV